MEREEGKQPPQKTPLHNQHEQANSNNFVLEHNLQEQSGTFTTFASFESETEGESSFDDNDYDGDADFFLSQEFESELQFLESEGSNYNNDDDNDEDMEEDNIDVDELTYEELIELGDFIGQEKRGLNMKKVNLWWQFSASTLITQIA
ncbi:E3 ubiquitin ligase BIG BROTHER-related-like isoform X2 [Glycine soja]|uniref:E3 ubiquitin ligase BIG BROTHER-related-like isoform X2 n=1 Tax=Glycine soja TaxID=3848 RepID=UPI00103F3F5F|nr:E3 ubiquitin ligase BIG BROTHER-related-like isoform X2 [Glycine soja]